MNDKVKRPFSSYLTNNLALKIFSMVFAIILWSFVINDTNPTRTKSFYDIPVKILGLESLEELGLTTRDDYSNQLFVTVSTSVAHSDFKHINESIVSASIDLSKITEEGTHDVPISVSFNNVADVSLLSISPSNFSIKVDALISADVPLTVNTKGTLKEGLVSVSPVYPETVHVSGSAFYVSKMSKAILEIDLSNLDDGDISTAPCTFYNALENVINFPATNVTADMDIQSTKAIKIDLSNAVKNTNKVATGFQYDGISANEVTICAHANVLKDITSVSALSIDLTGKNADFKETVLELDLPKGVSLLPNSSAPIANVKIIEAQSTLSIKRKISVIGLNGSSATINVDGNTYSVKDDGTTNSTATIILSGSASALDKIYNNDVSAILDLSSLGKGTHECTLTPLLNVSLNDQITAQIYSPTSVKVTIK